MANKGKEISSEEFEDYAKCTQNPAIMKQLDAKNEEKVIFSCICNKKNKFMFNQERIFLITNFNFYNIDKTKIQRTVPITSIQAFTKSIDPKNLSFIIHFENEYDYEFTSIAKYGVGFVAKIMNAVQYAFARATGYNLPVY